MREDGVVAMDAEYRKTLKCSHLDSTHCFEPVAVESLGVFGVRARAFFRVGGLPDSVSNGRPSCLLVFGTEDFCGSADRGEMLRLCWIASVGTVD